MLFNSQNLDIEEINNNGKHYLHFIFKGKFTESVSIDSCKVWPKKLNLGLYNYELVWNCLDMDGFEPKARTEWLNALKTTNEHISKIIVVSDNIVIRGASRLMLKLMSFEPEIVKSLDEVPWK